MRAARNRAILAGFAALWGMLAGAMAGGFFEDWQRDLCGSTYEAVERAAVADMPNLQLALQYDYQQPVGFTECHWTSWKRTLADEMAKRLSDDRGASK